MNGILTPILFGLVIAQGMIIISSGGQFGSAIDTSYELLDMVKDCRENPEKYMN